MEVGQDRCGETSFSKQLLEQSYDNEEPSTNGIEVGTCEHTDENAVPPWQIKEVKQLRMDGDEVKEHVFNQATQVVTQQAKPEDDQERNTTVVDSYQSHSETPRDTMSSDLTESERSEMNTWQEELNYSSETDDDFKNKRLKITSQKRASSSSRKERRIVYSKFVVSQIEDGNVVYDETKKILTFCDWEKSASKYGEFRNTEKRRKPSRKEETIQKKKNKEKEALRRALLVGRRATDSTPSEKVFEIKDKDIHKILCNSKGEISDDEGCHVSGSKSHVEVTSDVTEVSWGDDFESKLEDALSAGERGFDLVDFVNGNETNFSSSDVSNQPQAEKEENYANGQIYSPDADTLCVKLSDDCQTRPKFKSAPDMAYTEGPRPVFTVWHRDKANLERGKYIVKFASYGTCDVDWQIMFLLGKDPVPEPAKKETHDIQAKVYRNGILEGYFEFRYINMDAESLMTRNFAVKRSHQQTKEMSQQNNVSAKRSKLSNELAGCLSSNPSASTSNQNGERLVNHAFLRLMCYEAAIRGAGFFYDALRTFPFGSKVLKCSDGHYPDFTQVARKHGHEQLADEIEGFISLTDDDDMDVSEIEVKLSELKAAVDREMDKEISSAVIRQDILSDDEVSLPGGYVGDEEFENSTTDDELVNVCKTLCPKRKKCRRQACKQKQESRLKREHKRELRRSAERKRQGQCRRDKRRAHLELKRKLEVQFNLDQESVLDERRKCYTRKVVVPPTIMASSSEAKPNDFTIEIHSSILHDKRNRNKCIKKIITTINALLNTGGGSLTLRYGKKPSEKDVKEIVRSIDAHVKEFLPDIESISLVKIDRNSSCKILFTIKGSDKLCILDCHLYVPSYPSLPSRVSAVRASDSTREIISIIQRTGLRDDSVIAGSHHQHFVQNKIVELKESKTVYFKRLEANARNVSLADRIVKNNKLACYVSALANYCGGHIYYGIEDNGMVKGKKISEEERLKIVVQVTKAINRMICPAYDEAMKGKHWDIHFVPVVNSTGNLVSSTFVIVLYIVQCPPGCCMFTDSPESYHIVEGKVALISFDAWWTLFTSKNLASSSIPSQVPRIRWTSERNMCIYRRLTTKLVQLGNDRDMESFEKLTDFALKKYRDSIAGLVVLSEVALAYLKHCDFQNTRSTLKLFENSLKNYNKEDSWIIHVTCLYVKSRFQRAEGNYQDSYKFAVDGLQMMDRFPAEFIAVRFYVETATLATILASVEDGRKATDDLIRLERGCLDMASRNMTTLRAQDLEQRIVSDLIQKVRIYRAEAHMGCSLTGEASPDRRQVTSKDLDRADDELTRVESLNYKGNILTRFRRVQLLLAQSDLHYRRLQLNVQVFAGAEKQAIEYAEEASKLACENNFKELVRYAERRLNLFPLSSTADDVKLDVFSDDVFGLGLLGPVWSAVNFLSH